MLGRELAMATAFDANFGGFEGFTGLEDSISLVQNKDEVNAR